MRDIPKFGMSQTDSLDLQREGVVVIPFMESLRREPRRLEPHYHPFFQIFLLHGGAAVMHDFVEFDVRGTTLVFMTPGQVHAARPEPDAFGTTISFTQEFFDHQSPPPSLLLEFPFFYPVDVRPWISVPKDDPERLDDVTQELQREFDEARMGASEILRALLRILLVRANRLYAVEYPPKLASRALRLSRDFHLAVEQRFRELHSVADYAALLGITANHLNDVIREQTGRSAGDIIRERRLLDAKRLLLHSDLSVSEIAYSLNFEDPSYFSRFFRRNVQLTPAEFRQQIREKYQLNPP